MFRRFITTPFFTADGGSSGGAAGDTKADGNATGQQGQPAGAANGGESAEKKPTLAELLKQHGLQGELDGIIQSRLEREKQQRETAAEKARKDAEAKTLEEQGNFKTLAEQRAAELAAAQAKIEASKATEKTAERYQTALKTHVDSLLKDAPAHLSELLAKLDPAEQLEWITKNPDALKPAAAEKADKPAGRGTPQARTGQQGQQRQQPAQGQQQEQPRKRATL